MTLKILIACSVRLKYHFTSLIVKDPKFNRMIVDIASLSKYVYTQTASTLKASEKGLKLEQINPSAWLL